MNSKRKKTKNSSFYFIFYNYSNTDFKQHNLFARYKYTCTYI